MSIVLDFEKQIIEIQNKIDELKKLSEKSGLDMEKQIKTFEQQAQDKKKELYSNLKLPSTDLSSDSRIMLIVFSLLYFSSSAIASL